MPTLHGTLELRAEIIPPIDSTKYWVVWFSELGVGSEGETLEIASKNASEALQLWFETCIETGCLDQALQNYGDIAQIAIIPAHQEVSISVIKKTLTAINIDHDTYFKILQHC